MPSSSSLREDELTKALENTNSSYNKFNSLYITLLENGLEQTEYNESINKIAEAFKRLYANSKSSYDSLLMNRKQFEEGRLERDAFERSLQRIETQIYETEFEISTKILVPLRKVEKDLIDKHLIEKVKTLNIPQESKNEIIADAGIVREQMNNIESGSKKTTERVEGYVETGQKILEVGRKLWRATEKYAPMLAPTILRLFSIPV